jgi:hypothetical protein
MLEKEKRNFRVDKLRAILLFEAAFDQKNKKLGREMMYTAERLQQVAKEQYGSRKNKAAIDQCLNKRLTFDLARQLNIALLPHQSTLPVGRKHSWIVSRDWTPTLVGRVHKWK